MMMLVFGIAVLQFLQLTLVASQAKPGCQDKCGDVSIPYPFGIGADCSRDRHFNVSCENTEHGQRPYTFIGNFSITGIEVKYIEINITNTYNYVEVRNFSPCSYALLTDRNWFTFHGLPDLSTDFYSKSDQIAPMVLDWAISNHTCDKAEKANDYACVSPNIFCYNSTNGPGYRCNCSEGYQGNPYLNKPNITFKMFSKEDLEKATVKFNQNNILGQGGQGMVFKGVPMLVYEYISNGTLFQLIHGGGQICLKDRLRIATETASAIAYLHSAASPPILHGDIKSSNILLDENHMVKVSDFGASKLTPIDKDQFITFMQGTWGYLDPECLQTGQLTDKSDECQIVDILDHEIVKDGRMDLILEICNLAMLCLNIKGEERPTMMEIMVELLKLA
ncbi:Wall-associated receptor kinase 3 [Acorus gramineus]|uniref:Wall-associated receptor kinase 3 n=1 Tax=Acorus gramineus TaxID=55184 RepID=A0AAV8ZVQ4_ACOGR|nr:Wall-associated receptor kinase 3 [Acorus gramineus]